MATGAGPAPPALRVALMDFSTDDNSWRNSQAAANFTSLLQIQLANEPGVEWVERAQLDLAKQELKLSEMELIGGSSPIRRGKWVEWVVSPQADIAARVSEAYSASLEVRDNELERFVEDMIREAAHTRGLSDIQIG